MCVGGSFPGAIVTSTRKKAPFVSFDSARFVVKHPIYHLENSSDLPRLNAFKFRDVAFAIAVSFIFPPLCVLPFVSRISNRVVSSFFGIRTGRVDGALGM